MPVSTWHVTNGNRVNSEKKRNHFCTLYKRLWERFWTLFHFTKWIIISFRPCWITRLSISIKNIIHGTLIRIAITTSYFQSVYNSSLAFTVSPAPNFSHSIMILSYTFITTHGISPRDLYIKIIRNFASTNYYLLHRLSFQLIETN